MPRVKRGVTTRRRHKKMIKMAKGYRGLRSRIFTQAKVAVMKAGLYAYKHRRLKKRSWRRLWTTRINAATRAQGMSYSRFINGLLKADVVLDRKIMADLAAHHEGVFSKLVSVAKEQK